ncbi:MAG TPA: MFS transporter [Polyangiaceae bacterium]|nr:MFS transporter [Polyangiaceae bacterium]
MSESAVASPSAPALPEPNIWAVPGFREFMASMVLVTLANQIQGTVVAYQIYELTRDPLSLGAVGLAEALPFIAFALFGGHVADARDRRRVSLTVLYVMVAVSAGLLLLSLSHAALGVARHKFAIYTAIVILGMCRSFLQPARAALNAELLPPSLYAKGIAIRTSFFQLAMFAGPAGGGLLYAAIGPHGAYFTAGLLLAVAWVAMYRVPKVRLTQAAKSSLSVLHSIREGFSYLASDRLLLSALLLDLFGVLFGGATALLPVFANEILAVGSRGFGMLRAAPAVGALAASIFLASRPPLRRAGRTLLLSTAGFGLSIVAFALSKSFALSLGLLAASGALDMVSVVVRSTLLQLRVPGQLLGRVASINQIFIGSSNEIGAFESGVAARLMGVIPSVVFGGGMTLLVTGATTWLGPELRKLGRLDQVAK